MVDVSFVIVSWNARDYLLQCLESIEGHSTASTYEIIVVDNASHDGSADAVVAAHPSALVVRNGENAGFARGNNIGIEESSGRYLCCVNSDVILLPGCIDSLTAFMDRHPKVGMVAPRILNADRTIQPSCMAFPTLRSRLVRALALESILRNNATPESSEACDVDALSGCFWFLRREAVSEVGCLDERFFMYCEDLDWCRRFKKAGWRIVYQPEAQAIHFGGASSANAPVRFVIELEKAMLQYWRKHHGLPTLWIVWFLLLLGQLMRCLGGAAVWTAAALVTAPTRLLLRRPTASHLRQKAALTLQRSLALSRWLLLRSHGLGSARRGGARARAVASRGVSHG